MLATMAAMDVEEAQQLLEHSNQSRRSLVRPVSWVVAGLSAAAVAVVIWLGSADVSMRSARAPDSFTKLVKLNKAFGSIRQLATKTKKILADSDGAAAKSDGAAAEATELKDMTCDVEKYGAVLCTSEDAELPHCEKKCVDVYLEVLAACPADHAMTKASTERLSACKVGGTAEKKDEEKEAEALAEELATDTQSKAMATCMPLLLGMMSSCKMDSGTPDLEHICGDECQGAVKAIGTSCAGLEDMLGAMPLDNFVAMCDACPRVLFALGQPGSTAEKECKTEEGPPDVCADGCHTIMCDVLEKCPADSDSGIPAMGGAEMINEMRGQIMGEMKEKNCECNAK